MALIIDNATLVLPDGLAENGGIAISEGRISVLWSGIPAPAGGERINLNGQYLAPGFVDLHVHGAGGADFMDLTPEAFRTICQVHARHGTTSFTPTSTVAEQADYERFLELCRAFQGQETGGTRIVGAHLYGPYFSPPARGCHPALEFLTPAVEHVKGYQGFDDAFPLTVTIAPELPHAEELTRAAVALGVRVNIGHSYATLEQVEAAIGWGARHVDHLFCAMSDRARLRQAQAFPMRAGLAEATLMFPELTTEVIADGCHLADSLLRVAYRLKGPDRLALVSDSMRAVDMPDGEYWFGPEGRGEKIRRQGNVGVTLDGSGLASGVMGQDHTVRTMLQATGAPLHEVIRMASLTPATILGLQQEIGSIELGKRADFVVLDEALQVTQVFIGGVPVLA